MTEITKSVYASIIVTIISLTSGTTYYLEKTGDYKVCNTGWILNDKNGQYDCKDRGISEWCFELSAINKDMISTRCYIGRVIYQEPDYGDFAEKIEGNELIRHTDTYDYEVWKKTDSFNSQEMDVLIQDLKDQINNLEECDEKSKYYNYCMEEIGIQKRDLEAGIWITEQRLVVIK